MRYIKNLNTSCVFPWTEALAAKRDFVECSPDGTPLSAVNNENEINLLAAEKADLQRKLILADQRAFVAEGELKKLDESYKILSEEYTKLSAKKKKAAAAEEEKAAIQEAEKAPEQ
jgi:hypothetical protein